MFIKNKAGFTLVEVLIVVAILSVLFTIVIFDFVSFRKTSNLDNSVQEFVSILRLAQNKAVSSENYSKHGVYINTTISPNQYILFKGDNYLSEPSSYKIYSLQNNTEFYEISLGGGNEIVFDKLTGVTEEFGNISIRDKNDINQSKTIYVASSGAISFSLLVGLLDDSRIKDSRHLQFNYNRNIDTLNEIMTLTFDDSVTKTIEINSYLVGDQFLWQGTVSVGGENQTLKIKTHILNNPNTLFSVYRDRRYNNKSLKITLSEDSSGYLAQYSADGTETNFSSTFVSNFNLQ